MAYKLEFFCPDCDHEYGDGGWLQVITTNVCPKCGSFSNAIAYSVERSWGSIKDRKICPDGLSFRWKRDHWSRTGSPKSGTGPFAVELAKLLEIEADGEEASFVQYCLDAAYETVYKPTKRKITP